MIVCQRHYAARPCDACAHDAFLARVFPRSETIIVSPAVITYKPHVFTHMFHPWETPRAFDSPRELRAESERRGVTTHYLRDSTLWRSRDPRW